MPLIAIAREIGSHGERVAAGLGEALGCPVINHEIIDYVADKMRLRKSHVIKLLEGRASLFERLTADQTSLSIYTASETFALAARAHGAVFLSWGAAQLLAPVPHAIRVRICASLPTRCARVKQSLGSDDEEYVLHELRVSDEAHDAITKRHFGIRWREAEHYDLVLNTDRISTAACVDQVAKLARTTEFLETDESRSCLANLTMEAHVRGALRQRPETTRLKITVVADNGYVKLAGTVSSASDSLHAAQTASAVPGVLAVENHLLSSRRSAASMTKSSSPN